MIHTHTCQIRIETDCSEFPSANKKKKIARDVAVDSSHSTPHLITQIHQFVFGQWRNVLLLRLRGGSRRCHRFKLFVAVVGCFIR
jgi:hypothetical protein